MTEKKRVVITGIGAVTPLGSDNETYRDRLLAGESAAGPITVFDPASLSTRIAAQVDLESLPYKTRDRKVAFGVCAARQAMECAEQNAAPVGEFHDEFAKREGARARSGLCFGMGLELFSMPAMIAYLKTTAPEIASTITLQTPSDICLHIIAREHGLNTPPMTLVSACAASTDAMGTAFRLIREGRRSWMIAGGADSMLNPLGVGGFCLLQAMTTRNDDPARASRPFDRDRDGFLLGEAAAALVLEERERAIARGAKIYGEIVGYGNSFDAHGISEPHPEAEGAALALARSLADARLAPEEIVHINAHGTSTPKNDPVETLAIKKTFGKCADKITVSSTKSMIGHCISAAGAVEMAALLLCAGEGLAHPTVNLDNPDPKCDLNFIVGKPAALDGEYVMKNSFAFGGQNASLIVRVQG